MSFDYDVIVVGGGPAGMMAAATAASGGAKTLLLEKNERLGKKMLITGGGRCNLTNNSDIEQMVANIPGNGKFVFSSLHRLSGQDLRTYFEKLGIKSKVEELGKVFPRSNSAAEVVDALEKRLIQLGIKIQYRKEVDSLLVDKGKCRGVICGGRAVKARAVVLATGGLSFPKTGSTGAGYKMTSEVGHTITPLFPAAVAVTCSDPWIKEKEVQGISMTAVNITVYSAKGKVLVSELGDIIFTHWGISGPGALRVGRSVALEVQKAGKTTIRGEIDLFPSHPVEEIIERFETLARQESKKIIKTTLSTLVPERLAKVVAELGGVVPQMIIGQVNKETWGSLAHLLKALPVSITGTRPIEEATVTGGGIAVKEINPRSMESKIIKGLFIAGEVLDVDAHTGGFNMQVAFSTGYVAGESAAALALESID